MLQQLIQWARDLKTERPQPNQSFQIQSDVEMNWNDIPWKYRLDEIQTIKFDIFDMFSNINVQSFCWHHIQTNRVNQSIICLLNRIYCGSIFFRIRLSHLNPPIKNYIKLLQNKMLLLYCSLFVSFHWFCQRTVGIVSKDLRFLHIISTW